MLLDAGQVSGLALRGFGACPGLRVLEVERVKWDGDADLFAVRDEDCTQTELVTINTDTAQPIRLRPHRMSPAK
ncbi:hypothetical protein SKAU_G00415160 [Synaphobranchus kaupii]|uniref:Uncharacterized protein n=1 Tax=Synaphobranchus kaupii TaxID=118154 RepID=A0A9Q1I9J5_SYNKA|nr:hypothetical protein SKAU_G00415160 [Synaphobranchus kaupii]